jgi:hypothetical protein
MPLERPSCRSLGTLGQKKTKMGRPKLPKGEAKGRIVPVRFAKSELRGIESSARIRKERTSEWLRRVLPREMIYKGYLIELTGHPARPTGFFTRGWITNQLIEAKPIPVVPAGMFPTRESAIESGLGWCKELIDRGNMNDAKLQH